LVVLGSGGVGKSALVRSYSKILTVTDCIAVSL